MSKVERLRQNMLKTIELYGVGSIEALKASQELDVEISKEQLKININQSRSKRDHINIFEEGIGFVTLETCLELYSRGIETVIDGTDVIFITKSEEVKNGKCSYINKES